MQPSVSVIIPTLNAANRLPRLIELLHGQSLKPREIIIVDSSSEDETVQVARSFPDVYVEVIDRSTFNHGTTRHEALLKSHGDFVCFMTDDAVPANSELLDNLIAPMEDVAVAMVSGRQLPKEDARRFEQLVRGFNYSATSNVRTKDDLDKLGIKTFFASDACAAYRRSAYLAVGGFQEVNTNEDMLIAAAFIHAGYKVAYAADAQVYHSHNLGFKDQYSRNRAVGYFLETHSSDLACASEVSEGGKLVKSVSAELMKERKFGELFAFGFDCFARLAGNRAGRKEARREKEPR